MAYVIGIILALVVCACATIARLDRDRAFYPTVLFITASYYVLFAVMGGPLRPIIVESVVMTGFLVIGTIGFGRSLWLVVVGFAAHGVLDLVHVRLISNPGVPLWWPAFCLMFDVGAAAYLTWLLVRSATTPQRRAAVEVAEYQRRSTRELFQDADPVL